MFTLNDFQFFEKKNFPSLKQNFIDASNLKTVTTYFKNCEQRKQNFNVKASEDSSPSRVFFLDTLTKAVKKDLFPRESYSVPFKGIFVKSAESYNLSIFHASETCSELDSDLREGLLLVKFSDLETNFIECVHCVSFSTPGFVFSLLEDLLQVQILLNQHTLFVGPAGNPFEGDDSYKLINLLNTKTYEQLPLNEEVVKSLIWGDFHRVFHFKTVDYFQKKIYLIFSVFCENFLDKYHEFWFSKKEKLQNVFLSRLEETGVDEEKFMVVKCDVKFYQYQAAHFYLSRDFLLSVPSSSWNVYFKEITLLFQKVFKTECVFPPEGLMATMLYLFNIKPSVEDNVFVLLLPEKVASFFFKLLEGFTDKEVNSSISFIIEDVLSTAAGLFTPESLETFLVLYNGNDFISMWEASQTI